MFVCVCVTTSIVFLYKVPFCHGSQRWAGLNYAGIKNKSDKKENIHQTEINVDFINQFLRLMEKKTEFIR